MLYCLSTLPLFRLSIGYVVLTIVWGLLLLYGLAVAS